MSQDLYLPNEYPPSTGRQMPPFTTSNQRPGGQPGLGVYGSTPPSIRTTPSFDHQSSRLPTPFQDSTPGLLSRSHMGSRPPFPRQGAAEFERQQDQDFEFDPDEDESSQPALDPLELASDLAGVLELDKPHQDMLMNFIATNKGINQGLLNSQIVIHANQLQHSMLLKKIVKKLESHDEILNKMKSKIQDNPHLTKDQSKEVLSWAKKVVIEDNRLDFDNDALIAGVKKLLRNVQNSILEDFLNPNTSQAERDALDSEIRTHGSNAKALLRNTIMESLTQSSKAYASLTATTRVVARKFLGSPDLGTSNLAIRVLLLRQYARENPHLVTKGAKNKGGAPRPQKRARAATGDSTTMPPSMGNDNEEDEEYATSDTSLVMAFAGWLRQKYEDKQNWGEKFNEKKWVEYCNLAIENEQKDWPTDNLKHLPLKKIDAQVPDIASGNRTPGISARPSGNTPYSNVAGAPSTSGYSAYRQPQQGVPSQSGSPYTMGHDGGQQFPSGQLGGSPYAVRPREEA
ncbi:hypothetical protein V5O48_012588 [Marasmius crinis-equi]|uniref:Uncharacterized protein n=1 Tax=Marasmius crinis-equi TaxID=585013 RepID=A0ABR3F2E7_9AGAR